MTHTNDRSTSRLSLPIHASFEETLRDELTAFSQTQKEKLGLNPVEQWIESMTTPRFTRAQRSTTTILVGGLTVAHDVLVAAGLGGIGYTVQPLDCPDSDAFRVGKEYGNRGQCNPTYFTVGNLVKHLQHLRDERGLKTETILENYVFLTAGACGPCRFGMYVTEYRKALRDAGFDGFRVMLFQQQGGLRQASGDDEGLEFTPRFFTVLLKALLAGDVLNLLGYRIRPYEVVPGATDSALTECRRICSEALFRRRSILAALWRCRSVLGTIRVDRTRIKPKVAIIGEFWAMTTEGDGNYQLQRFIEQEGGEVDIQPVTAWLLYNIWEVRHDTAERQGLRGTDHARASLLGLGEFGVAKRQASLLAAETALRAVFQAFSQAAGLSDYHLPDMAEIARLAAPHYDNALRGGEGHMEVGKLIANVVGKKATMTLSVKPFGCMPSSSVSDGVQTLITERFPGSLFCAVETSGDGAVSFQSRVQMYLFKARQMAATEFELARESLAITESEYRSAIVESPFTHSLAKAPHRATTTATDVLYHLAPQTAAHSASPIQATRRLLRSLSAPFRDPHQVPQQ
jgi:predicted nucleotide-binding protein (sugar kinase/HSP70/actin superfamily)